MEAFSQLKLIDAASMKGLRIVMC